MAIDVFSPAKPAEDPMTRHDVIRAKFLLESVGFAVIRKHPTNPTLVYIGARGAPDSPQAPKGN